MNFEPQNGVTLGAVEKLMDQHYVHKQSPGDVFTISKLAIELEWVSEGQHFNKSGQLFRSPIVRGSPYTSMKYFKTTPRLYAERAIRGRIIVDNDESKRSLECGTGRGVYSAEPVLVQRELKFAFDTSDMTWLVFVSEPTLFECSGQQHNPADDPYVEPGRLPVVDFQKASYFDLRATRPMSRGMVRIAMANNCTTGQNPISELLFPSTYAVIHILPHELCNNHTTLQRAPTTRLETSLTSRRCSAIMRRSIQPPRLTSSSAFRSSRLKRRSCGCTSTGGR